MTAPFPPIGLLAEVSGSVSALRDNDLIATLLILVFGMALGIALICLLLVVYFLRTGRLATRRDSRRPESIPGSWKLPSSFYGTPCRWLAIRTTNMHWVQTALRLHNPAPCSWEEGLSAAHEQKLFIAPPVAGWILVFGSNLPDPAEDVDRCFHFIANLSRKLGEVQFFSFNRVVSHHAWVHADQGHVQRAYAWAGRTLWNQGRLSRAEQELRLRCFDYGESAERIYFAHGSPAILNTERVPLLASRWSIDPTAINARMLRESHGIAGEMSRSKTH